MSRPQPGTTRDDTDINLRRLEDYLLKKTEDGPFRFKAKFISDDIESTPKQIGQLISKFRQRDDVLIEFEKLTSSSPTTWEASRKTVCVECDHDHGGYDVTVNGASHCYACGFPKQRQRRNNE